jgi:hypothetical protein
MASTISSRGSGVFGAIIFVVFLVPTTSETAGAPVVLSSERTLVVTGWWWEMTRNVLDAVVTATEDYLVAAHAFASLDIDLFTHKVGLVSVANSSAHLLTCE